MNKLKVLRKIVLVSFMSFVGINGLWGFTGAELQNIEDEVQLEQMAAEEALQTLLGKDDHNEVVSETESMECAAKTVAAFNEAKRLQKFLEDHLTPLDDPSVVEPIKARIAASIEIIKEIKATAVARNYQRIAEEALDVLGIYLLNGDWDKVNKELDNAKKAAKKAENIAFAYSSNTLIQEMAKKTRKSADDAESLVKAKIDQDEADAKAKAEADAAAAAAKQSKETREQRSARREARFY